VFNGQGAIEFDLISNVLLLNTKVTHLYDIKKHMNNHVTFYEVIWWIIQYANQSYEKKNFTTMCWKVLYYYGRLQN